VVLCSLQQGLHEVVYEDGDTEVLRLDREEWQLLMGGAEEATAPAAAQVRVLSISMFCHLWFSGACVHQEGCAAAHGRRRGCGWFNALWLTLWVLHKPCQAPAASEHSSLLLLSYETFQYMAAMHASTWKELLRILACRLRHTWNQPK